MSPITAALKLKPEAVVVGGGACLLLQLRTGSRADAENQEDFVAFGPEGTADVAVTAPCCPGGRTASADVAESGALMSSNSETMLHNKF